WIIVSNLGVNDLQDADLYIRYYRQLEGMGYRVVVVSVNPSDGKRKDLNRDIDKFNKKMEASGLEYLDLCSHLREAGFDTTDGLHYQKSTSREIWNEINTYLANRQTGWREAAAAEAAKKKAEMEAAGQDAQAIEAAIKESQMYSGWLCMKPSADAAEDASQEAPGAQAGSAGQ
ncbi:MAG: hypothetical protein NC489_47140, partial [Ruminococcus flavefaciens]|nr:hypothetical protein [Ruminococcus flavefaciens]